MLEARRIFAEGRIIEEKIHRYAVKTTTWSQSDFCVLFYDGGHLILYTPGKAVEIGSKEGGG